MPDDEGDAQRQPSPPGPSQQMNHSQLAAGPAPTTAMTGIWWPASLPRRTRPGRVRPPGERLDGGRERSAGDVGHGDGAEDTGQRGMYRKPDVSQGSGGAWVGDFVERRLRQVALDDADDF